MAKDQNVRLRSGWFSERDACYLACGQARDRPEHRLRELLPTGEGLFAFRTMDDVLAALDRIESDYAKACRAARAVAEEYLEATQGLPRASWRTSACERAASSIFNADDFGYSRGINRGIVRGPRAGRRHLGHPRRQRRRRREDAVRLARELPALSVGPARELHERGRSASWTSRTRGRCRAELRRQFERYLRPHGRPAHAPRLAPARPPRPTRRPFFEELARRARAARSATAPPVVFKGGFYAQWEYGVSDRSEGEPARRWSGSCASEIDGRHLRDVLPPRLRGSRARVRLPPGPRVGARTLCDPRLPGILADAGIALIGYRQLPEAASAAGSGGGACLTHAPRAAPRASRRTSSRRRSGPRRSGWRSSLVAAKAVHWGVPEPNWVAVRDYATDLPVSVHADLVFAAAFGARCALPRRSRRRGAARLRTRRSASRFLRPGRVSLPLRRGEHADLRLPALAAHLSAALPGRRHGQHALVDRQLRDARHRGRARARRPWPTWRRSGPRRLARADAPRRCSRARPAGCSLAALFAWGAATLEGRWGGPRGPPHRAQPALGVPVLGGRRPLRDAAGPAIARRVPAGPTSTISVRTCERTASPSIAAAAARATSCSWCWSRRAREYLSLYGSRYPTTPQPRARGRARPRVRPLLRPRGSHRELRGGDDALRLPVHDLARVHASSTRDFPGETLAELLRPRGYRTAFLHSGHLEYVNQDALPPGPRLRRAAADWKDLEAGSPVTSPGEAATAVLDRPHAGLDRPRPVASLLRDRVDPAEPPPLRPRPRAGDAWTSSGRAAAARRLGPRPLPEHRPRCRPPARPALRRPARARPRRRHARRRHGGPRRDVRRSPPDLGPRLPRLRGERARAADGLEPARSSRRAAAPTSSAATWTSTPTVARPAGRARRLRPGRGGASSIRGARRGPTSTRPTTTTCWACARETGSTCSTRPAAATSSTTCRSDPDEKTNVAAVHPERCRELRQRVAAWRHHAAEHLARVEAETAARTASAE